MRRFLRRMFYHLLTGDRFCNFNRFVGELSTQVRMHVPQRRILLIEGIAFLRILLRRLAKVLEGDQRVLNLRRKSAAWVPGYERMVKGGVGCTLERCKVGKPVRFLPIYYRICALKFNVSQRVKFFGFFGKGEIKKSLSFGESEGV